jgi:protein-L-isoaspartate(D-aspartate) O-methyltransferase
MGEKPRSRPEADRLLMVEDQIVRRGVKDDRVLQAMREIPRHLFVPEHLISQAYSDEPLPIGLEQTISQPYIVAYMTEVLRLSAEDKVLEVGTGSGYQTAVLAGLVREVYTIERVESLSGKARDVLKSLGMNNIRFKVGDGSLGWREYSPFDAILVTAAPADIPEALMEQLAVGGRMIIPVGVFQQDLIFVERQRKGIKRSRLIAVRFVPLLSDG